jgi:anti-sigma regulatory factor (Ser/Thr protein kinase)
VNEARLAVPGDVAQLPVLAHFLQQFWSTAGLPAAALNSFELALEEIFMNVVMHGSDAAHGGSVPRVEVSVARVSGGVTMTVEDDGPPFDPLSLPAPDVAASLGERPIGGLGVFLVRQLMDSVSYTRFGACNRLSVIKRSGIRAAGE